MQNKKNEKKLLYVITLLAFGANAALATK